MKFATCWVFPDTVTCVCRRGIKGVKKWRDLTGLEKHKVFKQTDIPHLFPRLSQATNIQAIWMEFREIHSILQSTTPLNDNGVKIIEKMDVLFSIPDKACYTVHAPTR